MRARIPRFERDARPELVNSCLFKPTSLFENLLLGLKSNLSLERSKFSEQFETGIARSLIFSPRLIRKISNFSTKKALLPSALNYYLILGRLV